MNVQKIRLRISLFFSNRSKQLNFSTFADAEMLKYYDGKNLEVMRMFLKSCKVSWTMPFAVKIFHGILLPELFITEVLWTKKFVLIQLFFWSKVFLIRILWQKLHEKVTSKGNYITSLPRCLSFFIRKKTHNDSCIIYLSLMND